MSVHQSFYHIEIATLLLTRLYSQRKLGITLYNMCMAVKYMLMSALYVHTVHTLCAGGLLAFC